MASANYGNGALVSGMEDLSLHEVKQVDAASMDGDFVEEKRQQCITLSYDGEPSVEEINWAFLDRCADVGAILAWMNEFAGNAECVECHGTHSSMLCPYTICWCCGDFGHWDLVCPNKVETRLPAATIAEIRANANADVDDAPVPSGTNSGNSSDFDDSFDD